jgi:hypothetical protein
LAVKGENMLDVPGDRAAVWERDHQVATDLAAGLLLMRWL